jgi:hypothetical protein
MTQTPARAGQVVQMTAPVPVPKEALGSKPRHEQPRDQDKRPGHRAGQAGSGEIRLGKASAPLHMLLSGSQWTHFPYSGPILFNSFMFFTKTTEI